MAPQSQEAPVLLSPPDLGRREREFLLDALASNWLAPGGPHVEAFEREVAAATGVAHGAAVSSGTAGLHLALECLGVGPGDEVLTSTLTFAATANAIRYVGAEPVFLDSNRASWNMDPELLAEELEEAHRRGKRPAAVLVVHLYGQCCDMDPILALCAQHGVPVIEDAAEALGATYRGRPAGSMGRLGVFSFNANKIVTAGGGGMVVGNNGKDLQQVRFLANQAREPVAHYEHRRVGFNYGFSNLLAAMGRAQLADLEERVARRRAHNAAYRLALDLEPGVTFMPDAPFGTPTSWLTTLLVEATEFGASRDQVLSTLLEASIEARPVWKPMHRQPAFSAFRARVRGVADDLFQRGLCLPSGSGMSARDRDRVVGSFLATPRVRSTGPSSFVSLLADG